MSNVPRRPGLRRNYRHCYFSHSDIGDSVRLVMNHFNAHLTICSATHNDYFFPNGESILYHAIYANNLRLVQLILFLHPRLLHEKDRLGNTAEIQFALHAPSHRSKILMFLAACYSAHPPRNPYQGTTAHKHFFNHYADQLGLPKLLPIT